MADGLRLRCQIRLLVFNLRLSRFMSRLVLYIFHALRPSLPQLATLNCCATPAGVLPGYLLLTNVRPILCDGVCRCTLVIALAATEIPIYHAKDIAQGVTRTDPGSRASNDEGQREYATPLFIACNSRCLSRGTFFKIGKV